ncbi:hypothetical protein BKA58DRAFT_400849 [Alternaria rosae]|uniref:uncharacterized protein n=1 Tax=Alternaria rosae TaxID=1187941 RepID=UPI001E8EAC75|nr:uncharacterized protein BKA58DRAFT_400849 [Alternaria rosae]KAH6872636.1 hypothetical protein BKA58DRAFT_400849 [Alternaria rosae]
MLRTKITPKPGVVQHAIRRDLPMNIDSGLDTQPKTATTKISYGFRLLSTIRTTRIQPEAASPNESTAAPAKSSSSFDVQVSTELSHGALGISQQAVHGHLYGGIYDTSLGEEVEYLCDKKSPFKLTPIICHGEALNSGGITNILSTNKRAGSTFDAAIDISEFSCDQYGDFEGAVSAYVLITAPKNITKQVKTPLGSGANFQLHVVDESHKSKGQGSGFAKTLRSSTSSKEDMIGCQLEGGKLNIQDRQAEFLFLIGTTFTEPNDLAPFWAIAQIQVRVLLHRWEREKNAYDLKRMHSDHMELLGFDIKLAVHQTNAKPSKPSKTKENSSDVFGHLLTLISIRRQQNTRIPEPAPFNTQLIELPPMYDIVREPQYTPQELLECNTQTTSFAMDVVETGSNGRVVNERKITRDFDKQSQTIQLLCSLPSLHGIMHLFNDWGAKLTQSNMSKKFGLKGSPTYMTLPFTDNAARRTVLATCKNDPKMSTMCDNIQEIMGEDQQIMMDTAALHKVNTETLQGKPKDHLRKVIVTTQNCFTAMTAFDVISDRFPGTDVVLPRNAQSEREGRDHRKLPG